MGGFTQSVALDLRYGRVWLCEVSYAKNLDSLVKRFGTWSNRWTEVCGRVRREACLTDEMQAWPVYVWAFVQPDSEGAAKKVAKDIEKIRKLKFGEHGARVSALDRVAPWRDNRWPMSWTEKDHAASELVQFKGARA